MRSAPVSTPCEVEDDIEGIVIGPVVTTQTTIVIAELLLAVDEGSDVLSRPLDGVFVELTLSAPLF